MLKIYLSETEYALNYGDKIYCLRSRYGLCIKDESEAVDDIQEFGAYTKEAFDAYPSIVEYKECRKGMKAIYWTYDGPVYTKQWVAPNAKLVMSSSYEETSCSMKQLMDLPSDKVIAYLKQEGLNLTMNS